MSFWSVLCELCSNKPAPPPAFHHVYTTTQEVWFTKQDYFVERRTFTANWIFPYPQVEQWEDYPTATWFKEGCLCYWQSESEKSIAYLPLSNYRKIEVRQPEYKYEKVPIKCSSDT